MRLPWTPSNRAGIAFRLAGTAATGVTAARYAGDRWRSTKPKRSATSTGCWRTPRKRWRPDRQRETSIEDQVRRCREYIERAGGDPERAEVFTDMAISGASTQRPGFEALMAAVDAGTVVSIVTEDLSRISRDFADSAAIFKRLQYAQVPLIGVADGIDTSSKHAKLSFTIKSLVADLYLDDLRDKTLRGLEGRALAGFATGGVPYGYRTVPDPDGRGSAIELDPAAADIMRRVFRLYADGYPLGRIARRLNDEGIPSPRAGTRHRCKGWGASTVRVFLQNEKYAGRWTFKRTEWVKVPGANRRRPRQRRSRR